MIPWSIVLSVLAAVGLGGIIGLERELVGKPAGLRTNMLVAGAAALFVSLGDLLIQHYIASVGPAVVRTDPIRVIQAVIIGVSFLGAGTIIRRSPAQESLVEGLTTAASLLFSVAIGICAALHLYGLGLVVSVSVVVVLNLVGRMPFGQERSGSEF